MQLLLRLSPPGAARISPNAKSAWAERLAYLDQRMTTGEVLRVVGVHRATLYRWTRKGAFPAKHHSGGWLRSDIDTWLSSRVLECDTPTRANPGAGRLCVHT